MDQHNPVDGTYNNRHLLDSEVAVSENTSLSTFKIISKGYIEKGYRNRIEINFQIQQPSFQQNNLHQTNNKGNVKRGR